MAQGSKAAALEATLLIIVGCAAPTAIAHAGASPAPVGAGMCAPRAEPAETPVPDPLRCEGVTPSPASVPCPELAGDRRRSCQQGEELRSRAARYLHIGRAALAANHHTRALPAFVRAAEVARSDALVLAELGWARVLASSWCRAHHRGGEDAGEPVDRLDVVCAEADRRRGVAELERALGFAQTNSGRAKVHYDLARALHAMRPGEAAEHARASLCLDPRREVRELYASLLWAVGDAASRRGEGAGALTHYRQSLAVLPDAERERRLLERARRWERPFRWNPVAASEGGRAGEAYASLQDLCAAHGPAAEPCELLVPFEEGEGARFAVALWTPAAQRDGHRREALLVARTGERFFALGRLGVEHGDSRYTNAFFELIGVDHRPELPFVPTVVRWVAGVAREEGCDWVQEATEYVRLCVAEDGRPRCFAQATLGSRPYASHTMLATPSEAQGLCRDDDLAPHGPSEAAFEPSFELELSADQVRARRIRDGAVACGAPRDAWCALPGAPRACASRAISM